MYTLLICGRILEVFIYEYRTKLFDVLIFSPNCEVKSVTGKIDIVEFLSE
jgi:hypothetical protein